MIYKFFTNPCGGTYPRNIAAGCPYVVYVESNAARILRDESALFQRVVDAFDTVIDHSQQEATEIKNGRISNAHSGFVY